MAEGHEIKQIEDINFTANIAEGKKAAEDQWAPLMSAEKSSSKTAVRLDVGCGYL